MPEVTLQKSDGYPYVFVEGDLPETVWEEIDEELSYDVEDAEYTDAWQNNEWDGKEHLFRQSQNGSWYFPVGLLDRVQKVLDVYGVGYDVEGLSRPGRGDMGFAWNTDNDLREYQSEAVDDALRYGSGVIVMPTGTGKTFTSLRLAHAIDRPFIVIVHRKEIADQWVDRIEDVLDTDVARTYAGDRENGDVMVALYQSILDGGDVRDDVRLDHDLVFFDEAHTVAADTFSSVAMSIDAPYRFGMTATPEREDNATLEVLAGCGPRISNYSVEVAIEEGYLADPRFIIPDAPHSGQHYRDWRREYEEEIVKNRRRNKRIATEVDRLPRPVLITVERINHGERLESLIDDAVFIHGDHSDRDEIVEGFRNGEVPAMIATRGIVGEGFDVPGIQSFVVAGGLKSETALIQQVGRALRPDTDEAVIVDMADSGTWTGEHFEQRIRTYSSYYGDHFP